MARSDASRERSAGAHPGSGARRPERRIPTLEWVVGALGGLLVAGAIAYLVWQALWRDDAPPDVRLVAEEILDLRHGYLVRFRAFNEGTQPAAELMVEGELTAPSGAVQTGEATIDYLPPRSDRAGGLFFTQDPRRYEVRLRAKGYVRP